MITNILDTYYRAVTPDHEWYERAHEWCEALSVNIRMPLSTVCGVVAVLSPGTRWHITQRDAVGMLTGVSCYKPTTYMRNCIKAMDIIGEAGKESDVFKLVRPYYKSGMKCGNFYLNLRYPDRVGPVTIDRHALVIALGRPTKHGEDKLTPLQYNKYVNAYTEAARLVGIMPHEMQAATWMQYREGE